MGDINCYHCSAELDYKQGNVSRSDTCPQCGNDVRVCYNCMHYDESSYNECREPVAERIVNKDKSNFCDYFVVTGAGGRAKTNKKEDALKKLDDLFK